MPFVPELLTRLPIGPDEARRLADRGLAVGRWQLDLEAGQVLLCTTSRSYQPDGPTPSLGRGFALRDWFEARARSLLRPEVLGYDLERFRARTMTGTSQPVVLESITRWCEERGLVPPSAAALTRRLNSYLQVPNAPAWKIRDTIDGWRVRMYPIELIYPEEADAPALVSLSGVAEDSPVLAPDPQDASGVLGAELPDRLSPVLRLGGKSVRVRVPGVREHLRQHGRTRVRRRGDQVRGASRGAGGDASEVICDE